MPLIPKRSKSDKKSELAAAYGAKRKPKYAKGGQIPQDGGSAKSEKRPMPDQSHSDSEMKSKNSGNKPSKKDSWSDNSTVIQAQKPSKTALSRPKLVGSDAFSVRYSDMRDDEADMGDRLPAETDRAQPVKRDDEKGPNRQGHKVPDMHAQHDNKKAPYNKQIEDQYSQDMAAAEFKKVQSYAEGGPVMEPEDHEIELMERHEESDLGDYLSPSEDNEMADADSRNELDQDGHNPNKIDMEDEHSNGRKPYAEGGSIDDEEDIEHDASIAGAIMRKRMADGGQVDLSQNADEEPNNEDDLSSEALMKENYSESDGLDDLDQPEESNEHGHDLDSDDHDLVSKIMKRLKTKSPITK